MPDRLLVAQVYYCVNTASLGDRKTSGSKSVTSIDTPSAVVGRPLPALRAASRLRCNRSAALGGS